MTGEEPLTHEQIHRQIAEALASLVSDDPQTPPHPYISRYLAQHAARGHVLDDAHVPPSVLPWEKTTTVRRLLQQQTHPSDNQDWLRIWASIEPFIENADPLSRMTSLHLARHAARHRRQAPSSLPPDIARHTGSRAVPLWSDCAPPQNVWAVANPPLQALACATTTSGTGPTVLVSGDNHGLIRIWRNDGTVAAAPLQVHNGAVTHLLTLDDTLVASGGSDGRLSIIDVLRGPIVEYRRPQTWISSLILIKMPGSARLLLAAHSDGQISAYNTATFRPSEIPLPHFDDAPVLLAPVPGSQGQDDLLICAQHSAVSKWDGRRLIRLRDHQGPIRTLAALSRPGSYATSDPVDGLSFYDATTPDEPLARIPQPHPVTALLPVMLDEGPGLATGSSNGTIQLWDEKTRTPVGGPLQGHTTPITALALFVGRSRRRLVSAAADGIVRNWQLETPPPPGGLPWEPITAAALHGQTSSAGQPRLAVATGRDLRLWSIFEGSAHQLPVSAPVTALHWSQSQHEIQLAIALGDFSVQIYRQSAVREQLEHRGTLTGHLSPVTRMASIATGSGSVLGTTSADGTVRLWDLSDMQAMTSFGDHVLSVLCIDAAASDSGPLFASGGMDGKLRLWSAITRRQYGDTLRCDQHAINDVAFAPSADRSRLEIATAGEDGSLKTWDLSDGTPRRMLDLWQTDGQLSAVTWFRTNRQRPVLAAASRSRIHVWDAMSGSHLLEIVSGRTVTALTAHQLPDLNSQHDVLTAAGEDGLMVFALHLENL
ncbi:benzoate transporter (plasmid) [Streptomyces sp. NBC_00015]|uniref:WD40 repeat domain-containing protein n=1 Tax=Streptomyces sp. NBC_00015 TaxID=2903611 RepID=UPI002F9196BC